MNKDEFFTELTKIITYLNYFYKILREVTKDKVEKYIIKLKKFQFLLELNKSKYKIFITERRKYEEIANEIQIDLKEELYLIIAKLNEIIDKTKIVVDEFEKYLQLNLKDNLWLEEIKKEIYIKIPKIKLSDIDEKKDEIIQIKKDITDTIPYFTINQEIIEGNDEFKYNLGTLNLYNSEYQNIYFASFNENVLIELDEGYKDYKLLKKNKLYLLKIRVPEKKREEDEIIIEKINLKLSYKDFIKKVKFNITYKLEAIQIYLQCNEYKLEYNGTNSFNLCSLYLYKDETINFIVKNNSYLPKIKNLYSLQSSTNNTCQKPIIIEKEEGFCLIIKSEDLKEFLSFYINIYINNRFKFIIKIESKIKIFDYDLIIKYIGMEGYVFQKLSCSLETEEFELMINTNQNREFNYLIEIGDQYNNINISSKEISGNLFNSKKIKLKIQLKKKKKTKVNITCTVDGLRKILLIDFNDGEFSNLGIQNIEEVNIDNSNYFSFYLNEIKSKGIKKNSFINFNKQIKNVKNLKIIGEKKTMNLQHINLSLIKYPKLNIDDILNFYNEISEFTLLLPIYINYLNVNKSNMKNNYEKQNDIIKKNYWFLFNIYSKIMKERTNNNNYYSQNFFYKEISEFTDLFSELIPMVDFIKKISKSNLRNKIIKEDDKQYE